MKKFKLTSKQIAIIVFTTIQVLCVFIAAAFVLQADACPSPYYDILGCLMYLGATVFFEWLKYKIIHDDISRSKDLDDK